MKNESAAHYYPGIDATIPDGVESMVLDPACLPPFEEGVLPWRRWDSVIIESNASPTEKYETLCDWFFALGFYRNGSCDLVPSTQSATTPRPRPTPTPTAIATRNLEIRLPLSPMMAHVLGDGILSARDGRIAFTLGSKIGPNAVDNNRGAVKPAVGPIESRVLVLSLPLMIRMTSIRFVREIEIIRNDPTSPLGNDDIHALRDIVYKTKDISRLRLDVVAIKTSTLQAIIGSVGTDRWGKVDLDLADTAVVGDTLVVANVRSITFRTTRTLTRLDFRGQHMTSQYTETE